ncbi:Xaa-Pro aminopeptidase [Hoeflea halophila]|uniref:Xaa-Pro aminopeptidase n=2 Tax=Hoeflea halophila TaxID=714899 RepID=A0A286IDE0_9HYPH|nr:Xaa-Pro aminopeptidase [Hoeflea halophila]
MAEAGLDAIILLSPESFRYATGALPGVATMWRNAGAVAVLIPADETSEEAAVVSDLFARSFRNTSHITDVRESPIWVETTNLEAVDPELPPEEAVATAWHSSGRSEGFQRPETFDPMNCYRHLADILSERGLDRARIGFEASAISASDVGAFQAALGNVVLVDASDLITRLKMVKTAEEIAHLRLAVEIAEGGIRAVQEAIQPGVTRNALAEAWKMSIENHSESKALSGSWEYISVGKNPWGGNAAASPGDLIKVDVGCLVNGYTSDTGRTFVLGTPCERQTRLFDALMDGFVAGSDLLRPGVPLSEVYRATLAGIRAAGFPGYSRGHFGHGLGAGLGSEEWPFISARSDVIFEPGMVMAFECPWYIDGLGGMIIENQLLITDTGHEMMNRLPLDLVRIPV